MTAALEIYQLQIETETARALGTGAVCPGDSSGGEQAKLLPNRSPGVETTT